MTKQSTVGEYTFYKGVFGVTNAQVNSTTFELKATIGGQVFYDTFNRINTFKPPTGAPAPIPSSAPAPPPTSNPATKVATTGTTTTTFVTVGANAGNAKAVAPQAESTSCGTDAGCDADDWVYETPALALYTMLPATGTPIVVTKAASGLIVAYTGAATSNKEVSRGPLFAGLAALVGAAVL